MTVACPSAREKIVWRGQDRARSMPGHRTRGSCRGEDRENVESGGAQTWVSAPEGTARSESKLHSFFPSKGFERRVSFTEGFVTPLIEKMLRSLGPTLPMLYQLAGGEPTSYFKMRHSAAA
jgi:hypothetical protein